MVRFRLKPIFLLTFSTFLLHGISALAHSGDSNMIITDDIKHDISSPLGSVGFSTLANITLKNKPIHLVDIDSLIPIQGFQGLGVGLGHYKVTSLTSNVSGSVGMLQYMQWVENDIAIFDKSTGLLSEGFPKSAKAMWSDFTSECDDMTPGNGIVKYDQISHRWIFAQNTYKKKSRGPYYQCIAVSTSEDPTGSYYRYAFKMNALNESGRLALWDNAYYMSFNMSGKQARGPRVCALEQKRMLRGLSSHMVCKQFSSKTSFLLPADLEGRLLPESKTPEYLMGLDEPNNLVLYRMAVDFSDLDDSRVTGPLSIPVSTFKNPCPSGNNCMIQPGTPNKLDIVGDRLMNRLVYRQFVDHAALVANHTVEGPLPKLAPAIRWYEFRVTGDQNPVIYQQSTEAPDSMNRSVGSISIDRYGNIALGYTVTSSLIYPSLELSGHNYHDLLDQMTIQPLFTGEGSQVNQVHAWPADSVMSVDPEDDCTFWYTNQYLRENGSYNWSSYILNFKMAACS